MTTWIRFDADTSSEGVVRRLREEMARRAIRSDRQAALRYGRPQQWVSRRMTGDADWRVAELRDFCAKLSLDYVYITTGIRTISPPPDGGGALLLPRMDSNHQPPDSVIPIHRPHRQLRKCA